MSLADTDDVVTPNPQGLSSLPNFASTRGMSFHTAWVINRIARGEHFWSAYFWHSGIRAA
jgi:hypothetical protein